MSADIKLDGIPDQLQPLYICSARESLSIAETIIKNADIEVQKKLLLTADFSRIVNSALTDLDEHRSVFQEKLILSFDPILQDIATYIFSEE
jgi:hypothetical protein